MGQRKKSESKPHMPEEDTKSKFALITVIYLISSAKFSRYNYNLNNNLFYCLPSHDNFISLFIYLKIRYRRWTGVFKHALTKPIFSCWSFTSGCYSIDSIFCNKIRKCTLDSSDRRTETATAKVVRTFTFNTTY